MTKRKGSILIVDDNEDLLIALKLLLSRNFTRINTLRNPNLLLSELEKTTYDLVLLDMNFKAGQVTGNEGIYWMTQVRQKFPDISVVFITAFGDVELAVKSMKEGAADFIMKSWDEQKILSTVLSAFELGSKKKEINLLKKKQAHLAGELEKEKLVCQCKSSAMMEIRELVRKVALTDANVLITGENGTGKEVIAREIHQLSTRNREIFVKVDLGSLPESLFESELFGHVKGAFTDAQSDRDGRFLIASGGTLFLDEIGNLPLSLQTKLLSVLQNKEIYPLGSSRPLPTDVRIISATNANLGSEMDSGNFREDLFYRINSIQIEIPPLRERREDISLLAGFFLEKYRLQYNRDKVVLGRKAMERLERHSWPGNIRELEHCIEKAVILTERGEIGPDILFSGPGRDDMEESINSLNLEEVERSSIQKALRQEMGNVSSAARILGINRSTLYQKMKKYGI